MDLNKVMVIGRLTRDPEMRTTGTGLAVCQISVATGYVYTNQATGQKVEQTEFHNVVLWRKLAEISGQYLSKGKRVYIEGRLQTRQWDAQDGSKRSRTEIVADNLIMLDGGKPAGSVANNQNSDSDTQAVGPTVNNNTTEEIPTIQMDDSVGDIPF